MLSKYLQICIFVLGKINDKSDDFLLHFQNLFIKIL